jgi:hypothetical protein
MESKKADNKNSERRNVRRWQWKKEKAQKTKVY